jgi:hypothetical protein
MSFTWGGREWITYNLEMQRDENMARTIFQQKPATNKRSSVKKIKQKHLFIRIIIFR